MRHTGPLPVAFALLAACCSLTPSVSAQPSGYEGYQVVRIEITDEAELDTLRDLLMLYPDFELWSEVLGIGPMDVRVAPAVVPLLEDTRLCYDVVIEDVQKYIDEAYGLHDDSRDDDFFDYLRTYDEYVQFMNDLVATHPDLAEMISVGLSVEGRPLWALRITGPGSDKPGVMYHGAQHGNEKAGASVVAYAAHHILTNYDSDPDIAALVDNVEWFLLPIMNPDGYVAHRRYNANGVDLNRNWGGLGSGEVSTGGPYPFSEPETAAMRDFFLSHPHVRVHIDFHGYIDMLLWPWGHIAGFCEDHWTFRILGYTARDLVAAAGGGYYLAGPVYTTIYPVSGGSVDYTYGDLGVWALAFELRDDSVPDNCYHFLPTMLFMSEWIADCDNDGILNADEIAAGSDDCNLNGIPDECEADCNGNSVADPCEIASGLSGDCNGNRRPDDCDIADGTSIDCDLDGIPDECSWDCNGNRIADSCDIATGVSDDCTGNGIPDECEPDCNQNGVPDSCDVENGDADDCDGNLVLDECELSGFGIALEPTLLQLELNHAAISSLIPDRFDFSEGHTGYLIRDGGEDMFEYGNRLNTNRADRIPYTDGLIRPAEDRFGPGSRYFTLKRDGLFILVASEISTGRFVIRGHLGTAGAGSFDTAELHTTVGNLEYTVFVKRVFGAASPSVNHLFIVRGDGVGLTHVTPDNTYQEWNRLFDMQGVSEIIYVLVAGQNGAYLDDTQILDIANATLTNIEFRQRDCNANGIPDQCDCWGDLDGDGSVDLADLAQLLSHYGDTGGTTYYDGDLDCDGDVDLADLAELLGHYGEVCE